MSTSIMTPHDVGRRLGVTSACVRLWITRGTRFRGVRVRLAATRVGQGWRISQQQLDDYLAALNPEPAARKLMADEAAARERGHAAARKLGWE